MRRMQQKRGEDEEEDKDKDTDDEEQKERPFAVHRTNRIFASRSQSLS